MSGGVTPLPPPFQVPLTVLPDQPCPYLPGRADRARAFRSELMPPEVYGRFMDARFRRAGDVFYQPICPDCWGCVPIRLAIERFRPSKSQRRCMRRNSDLESVVSIPEATIEKFELYHRYVTQRHRGAMSGHQWEDFVAFLYESPVDTLEICHRARDGRLLGVGICDVSERSLSTVYFYFEPKEKRRGLGTFGSLFEIALAAQLNIPWYYMGFWIDGCGAMEYKADFRPCEYLHTDGQWRSDPPPRR